MQSILDHSFIDTYSERFAETVSAQFFENQPTITGKEILNVTSSKQVNFFVLKALFTKWQEEMKKLESPYFNFKDPDVRKAMVSFMNVLSQKIEMDRESFKQLLVEATRDTLLLLGSPAAYVHKEFEDKASTTLSDKAAKTFLKYIKVYKEEIEQVLNGHIGKPADEFHEEVEYFFESQDIEKISSFELSLLAQEEEISLGNLYEVEEEDEDRGFEPEIDDQEGDEVEDTAENKTIVDEEPEVEEPEEVPEQPAVESIKEEPEEREPEPPAEPVADADPHEELEDPESEEVIESAETASDHEELEAKPINEQLSDQSTKTIHETFEEEKVTLADHHQQSKVGSIMEAISVNNRYMFTKELFDGDKEQFEAAIASLEDCESFDDAVEKLVQEYAKNLDWDMNSDEVKELLKVVFRKFR